MTKIIRKTYKIKVRIKGNKNKTEKGREARTLLVKTVDERRNSNTCQPLKIPSKIFLFSTNRTGIN